MPPTPKEITDCYSDYRDAWREIYAEGDTDIRYLLNDPWAPEDKDARRGAGRPCISLDELNQYVNMYTGNLRQSNIAIEVTPEGDGANDENATKRQSIIRGIEYKSNASQGAYITAAESAVSRGYGFSVLRTEYKEGETFDQEIKIQRLANPNMVLLNPNFKEANASDIDDGFLIDLWTKKKFKEKYPKARLTDFADDMGADVVSDWIQDKYVRVAEYWKIEHDRTTILLIETPQGMQVISAADYKAHALKNRVSRERVIETPRVVQYLTNGVEILDEVPWAGSRIPIISCFGKEVIVNEGGRASRKLLSLVRLARDAQMAFNYFASGQTEVAGQIPKIPFIGYKGQFESDKGTWETLTKVPHAFAQADVVIDAASGQVLPLPQWQPFNPDFAAWESVKDSLRRSIQASMGITPLPTAAQRDNEKSGVALEKINTQESVGSFHFKDNFTGGYLHNMGWQINDLIKPIMDTQRTAPIVKPDGTFSSLQVVGNTSHPIGDDGQYEVAGLDEDHFHTGQGNHGINVSDGPGYQSEREAQSAFVDKMLEEWQQMGIPPGVANKVLAKAIRMKDLGPVGDDIANLLDPPDPSNLPPEAQAVIANMQGQMQQLQTENQALHMDRAGRVLEQQTKVHIETMKGQNQEVLQHIKTLGDLIKAEMAAKSRSTDVIAESDADTLKQMIGVHGAADLQHRDQAHELAMSSHQHEQAKEMADKQAALVLVQGDAQHAQSRDLAQQQADLAPEPKSGAES